MSADLPRRANYDLHLHSSWSDGRYAPGEVLERAAAGGLDVIALTDHDLVGGLDPGVHAVGTRSVRVLAAAELTGVHAGREFHLLAYFPREAPTAFHDLCAAQTRARAARYDAAVGVLGLEGVDVAPPSAWRGELALTRHHLGRELVRAGHATSLNDAFSRLLGPDAVPHLDLPFVECIRIARDLGAVTSWAHPPTEALRAHAETFAAAGLHGIEGMRPSARREDRVFAKKLARRLGLLVTGGSDWHGWGGVDLGLFRLRGEELDPFLAALAA